MGLTPHRKPEQGLYCGAQKVVLEPGDRIVFDTALNEVSFQRGPTTMTFISSEGLSRLSFDVNIGDGVAQEEDAKEVVALIEAVSGAKIDYAGTFDHRIIFEVKGVPR